MNRASMGPRENLRIILAIAAKDVADALKNRKTLSTVVLVVFIMLLYKGLPMLWGQGRTKVVVYAPEGNSVLVTELEDSPDLRVRLVPSMREFEEYFNDGDEGDLALTIPADLDHVLAGGGQAVLGGYVLWDRRFSTDLIGKFEQRLTELVGKPVTIQIEGTVIPEPDSMGAVRMVSLMMLVAPLFIGTLVVPQLLLEERRTKTLDTLLVSPASGWQVVAGKALAGLFYVLTAEVVVLAFNWTFIVHWGLVVLAVLLCALLSVGLGLLLGIIFTNNQQLNIWTLILGQLLLVPVFLSMIDPILPEKLRAALSWVPTVSLALLFRYSFTSGAGSRDTVTYIAIILGTALVVLSLAVWRVRRSDR